MGVEMRPLVMTCNFKKEDGSLFCFSSQGDIFSEKVNEVVLLNKKGEELLHIAPTGEGIAVDFDFRNAPLMLGEMIADFSVVCKKYDKWVDKDGIEHRNVLVCEYVPEA